MSRLTYLLLKYITIIFLTGPTSGSKITNRTNALPRITKRGENIKISNEKLSIQRASGATLRCARTVRVHGVEAVQPGSEAGDRAGRAGATHERPGPSAGHHTHRPRRLPQNTSG